MAEALAPAETQQPPFPIVRRGYDRNEVDAYLRELENHMEATRRDLEENAYQRLGEEMGRLLQHARDAADNMLVEAETEAQRIKATAEGDASTIRARAEEKASAMVAAATEKVRSLERSEQQAYQRMKELSAQLADLHTRVDRLQPGDATPDTPVSLVTDEEIADVIEMDDNEREAEPLT